MARSGPGPCSDVVPENPEFDPIPLIEQGDPILWPIAVLDLVIDNADRKAGHILADPDTGDIRAIDHGLCLHPEPKLRTVLWAFAGQAPSRRRWWRLSTTFELASSAIASPRSSKALGEMEAAALLGRLDALLATPGAP